MIHEITKYFRRGTRVVRDGFLDVKGVGTLNNTDSVPAGAKQYCTDTANHVTLNNSLIFDGARSAAYNDPSFRIGNANGTAITIGNGTAIIADYTWTSGSAVYGIGLASATTGNSTAPGVGVGSASSATVNSVTVPWGYYHSDNHRRIALVQLPSSHMLFELGGQDAAKLLFVGVGALLTPAYVGCFNYNAVISYNRLSVMQLPSTGYNSNTGIATSVLTSPSNNAIIGTEGDCLVEVTWTPQSNEVLTLFFNRTDDDTYMKLVCDQAAGNMKLYTCVRGGAVTQLSTTRTQAFNVGTSYRLVAMTDGDPNANSNTIGVVYTWCGSTVQHQVTSGAVLYVSGGNTTNVLLKGSTAKVSSTAGSPTLSNFIAWPRNVSLSNPVRRAAATITSPSAYQVIQRSGTTGTINVTGTFVGFPTAASATATFNGGTPVSLTLGKGYFSGTMTSQGQGAGPLTVTIYDSGINILTSTTITPVGIGDVYVLAGQSNMVSLAKDSHTYITPVGTNLFAGRFHDGYRWRNGIDNIPFSYEQTDSVNAYGGGACPSDTVLLRTNIIGTQPATNDSITLEINSVSKVYQFTNGSASGSNIKVPFGPTTAATLQNLLAAIQVNQSCTCSMSATMPETFLAVAPTGTYFTAASKVGSGIYHAVMNGSPWPIVASSIMASASIPVGFIPCALSGSAITQWQPGADHQNRSTLYGAMVYRTLKAGGCKAVLWWQGEADAGNGMSQATYQTNFEALTTAIVADLGCKIMPCKYQTCSGIALANQQAIWAAIGYEWANNANVLTGPDLTDQGSDDAYHLIIDAKVQTAASRWWSKIQTAFY